MTDAQLARCRQRLEQFVVDLLEPVGRSERRHWGSVYVRGLLLDGERKSVEPMALRLLDGNEWHWCGRWSGWGAHHHARSPGGLSSVPSMVCQVLYSRC